VRSLAANSYIKLSLCFGVNVDASGVKLNDNKPDTLSQHFLAV